MTSGWPLILVGRLVSRFGKGLRGPLRDAIVTQAISPDTRGRAFGFHRAMDTLGAVAGPLLGVAAIFFVGGLYVAVQEALESAVTASMVDAERLAMS